MTIKNHAGWRDFFGEVPRAVRIGWDKNVCDAVDSRLCGNDEGFLFWIFGGGWNVL